jgi:glycosyltransferase involved in cell wall biosynthesis
LTQKKPLLSILIPTYRCVHCIQRILKIFEKQSGDNCEIIISDDSPGDEVVNFVSNWKKKYVASKWNVTVHHNTPSLGAVDNWNSLLDKAQGDYCLLLHHDEFPLGDNFINKVTDVLSINAAIDVLIMDCVLVDIDTGFSRQHAPSWLRNLSAKYFPEYLFRRNIIGPVSTLIVRRSVFPRFNEKLQWLVDVELYVRLFTQGITIKTAANIQIGSAPDKNHSITASLGNEVFRIKQRELEYLRDLYGDVFWIKKFNWKNPVRLLLYLIESLLWLNFKVFRYAKSFYRYILNIKNPV